MFCIKVKKMLNEAKLKGGIAVQINHLSLQEIQELEECGYKIKKLKHKYLVYEE